MAKVLIRVTRTYDITIEAEYGDTDADLLARVESGELLAESETRVICGRADHLEAAAAYLEAATPSEPSHSRSLNWSVTEMDEESYRKAKREAEGGNEDAAASVRAYEAAR